MEEDMIWGKNRHLFGGGAPANMQAFSASVSEVVANDVVLDWTLPEDSVDANGNVLCSVGGVVIRHKQGEVPENEFDGDLVYDGDKSLTTVHYKVTNSALTHYFRAFIYSTEDVYNRSKNSSNVCCVNEVHTYDMDFAAKNKYDTATSTISVALSVATGSDELEADKITIRKTTDGYAKSPEDGTEIATTAITTGGTYNYTDADVTEGTVYYYTVFGYSTASAAWTSSSLQARVLAKKCNYYYGYDLKESDSNPDTRVSYPAEVDNALYTKATPINGGSMGGWQSLAANPGTDFMPRPCMLTYDGVVDYYLDPDDYSKKADGTSSDIANTSYSGNVMIEWPKIYTKRWASGGVYHFRCSDVKLDDDYECWCNYDKDNNQTEHFYTAAYDGSLVNAKLRSLSGRSVSVNITRQQEVTYALANGAYWYTGVLADRLLINDLLTMMSKSTNGQTSYGSGTSGLDWNNGVNSGATKVTGSMNAKGMFWGDNGASNGVKVFGIENWWGAYWKAMAGLINDNGVLKAKITRGTKDGTSATDYNFDGSGYLPIGSAPSATQWQSAQYDTEYGRLPKTASGGSSSTYECDYVWPNNSRVDYALVGGNWADGLSAGPFYVSLGVVASDTVAAIGAALSYKKA